VIVSNFSASVRPASGETLRRVGYRLQITSLATSAIEYVIECRLSPPFTDGVPDQFLTARLSPTPNGEPIFMRGWRVRDGALIGELRFILPPGKSTEYQLDVRDLAPDEPHNLSFLGTIVLRVPATRSSQRFGATVQAADPIKVLLAARREESQPARSYMQRIELPREGSTALETTLQMIEGGLLSSAAIPLASSQALVELEAEGLSLSNLLGQSAALEDYPEQWSRLRGALDLDDGERLQALVDLLALIANQPEAISLVNDWSSRLGIPLWLAGNRP
jgi:hypothetical protein